MACHRSCYLFSLRTQTKRFGDWSEIAGHRNAYTASPRFTVLKMIPTVNITRKENHISVEVLIARDRKDEALHDLLVTDNAGFKWSVPIRVYAYDAGICET